MSNVSVFVDEGFEHENWYCDTMKVVRRSVPRDCVRGHLSCGGRRGVRKDPVRTPDVLRYGNEWCGRMVS